MSARVIAVGTAFTGDQRTLLAAISGSNLLGQREIGTLPPDTSGALGSGMTKLKRNLGLGVGMDEMEKNLFHPRT